MVVYEGMFILDAAKFARDQAATAQQVTDLITQFGGTILASRLWDERKLAYPIKDRSENRRCHGRARFGWRIVAEAACSSIRWPTSGSSHLGCCRAGKRRGISLAFTSDWQTLARMGRRGYDTCTLVHSSDPPERNPILWPVLIV